jgi:hypothetical protein
MPPLIAWLASWWTLLISLIVGVALSFGFRLIEKARLRYTSQPTLDGRRHGYTAEDALAAMQRYGAEGRRLYLLQETTLDLLFPATYAVLLGSGIALGLATSRVGGWWWALCLGPFLGAAFDYLENACVVLLLLRTGRGERPLRLARTAVFATAAKWRVGTAALYLAVLWLLVAIVLVLVHWLVHA